MSAQDLRITIIRAWTFADSTGGPATTMSVSAHRARYAQIRSLPPGGRLRLPWPPFRSNFWFHQLGGSTYESTEPPLLVGALVPLRVVVRATFSHPWSVHRPLAELYLEPFGVWTSITVDLIGAVSQQDPNLAAAVEAALKGEFALADQPPSSQLRDGLSPAAVLTELGEELWPGLDLIEAGAVRLLSDRIEAGECKDEAKRLFAGHQAPGDVEAHPLKQTEGAFAASSSRVGLALSNGSGAAPRLKCLHHNQALLLGHLLLLGAEVRQQVPAGGLRYQDLAARVLNHLHRGVNLELLDSGAPKRLGIYRSRIAPVWLDGTGLSPVVNQRTDTSVDGKLPHI